MSLAAKPSQVANFRWVSYDAGSGRWHCDGEPIHAGCGMELFFPGRVLAWNENGEATKRGPSRWGSVCIESEDRGRVLVAYLDVDGLTFRLPLDAGHRLRWHRESTRKDGLR